LAKIYHKKERFMNRLLFSIFASILAGVFSIAFAQPPSGSVPMTATVAQTPLTMAQGSFDASPLVAGQCYKIPADIQNPLAFGLNTNMVVSGITISFSETIITGDILSFVLVTFAMPPVLTPTSAGPGVVRCMYDGVSAAWGPASAEATFFNPQTDNPKIFQLDASGALNIILSANLCVDENATADTYQGDALVAAQYTGTAP
jgi:hypothetical protein